MAFKDILAKFRKGLARTARLFDVRSWFGRTVDQDFLDDLEARLIQSDVGVKATRRILDRVREVYANQTADEDLVAFVKAELKALLEDPRPGTLNFAAEGPTVLLIAGVNDSLDQVKPLSELARRLHDKVNLIPYNSVEGLPWQRPADAAQDAFLHALEARRTTVTLRREKGHDIDAACGQLRLKTERELRHLQTP